MQEKSVKFLSDVLFNKSQKPKLFISSVWCPCQNLASTDPFPVANGDRFDPDIQKTILPNLNYPGSETALSIYYLAGGLWLQKETDKKRGRPVSWLLRFRKGVSRPTPTTRRTLGRELIHPLTAETFRRAIYLSQQCAFNLYKKKSQLVCTPEHQKLVNA